MATKRARDDGTSGGERPLLSDADLGERVYSPVCTWCKRWEAGDGRHCAGAYPRGGAAKIPDEIWSGAVTHVHPYPSASHPTDHGVHFDLHPDVDLATLKGANARLYVDYVARERAGRE